MDEFGFVEVLRFDLASGDVGQMDACTQTPTLVHESGEGFSGSGRLSREDGNQEQPRSEDISEGSTNAGSMSIETIEQGGMTSRGGVMYGESISEAASSSEVHEVHLRLIQRCGPHKRSSRVGGRSRLAIVSTSAGSVGGAA